MLNKPTGNESCAESWEIVDHGEDQSVVSCGPWKGKTLHSLIEEHGSKLLGDSWLTRIRSDRNPENLRGRFPLLLKFLDASKNLSVQVHPNDVMGATLSPPDLGKTEAWYVMAAEPDARIYAGLKENVDRQELRRAIDAGTTEELLNSFSPSAGDCIFIQAGTLHAIGAGLVIAEIQQASNTTFRVFDWNRVDARGNSRELHIEESLQAINFAMGPVFPSQPVALDDDRASVIANCDKFVMRKWSSDRPVEFHDNRLRLLAVTEGSVSVTGDPSGKPLGLAETVMIPAICNHVSVVPIGPSEFLEIVLPD